MTSVKKEKESKKNKDLQKNRKNINELIDISPEEEEAIPKAPELRKAVQVLTKYFSYSGPLPLPEFLKGYGDIDKSFPGKIIKMAEKEQNNRHSIQRKDHKIFEYSVETERKEILRGQNFGLIIGLSTILGGLICILNGQPVAGSVMATTGVVSLVSVFVIGRSGQDKKVQKKEDKDKIEDQDKIEVKKPQ